MDARLAAPRPALRLGPGSGRLRAALARPTAGVQGELLAMAAPAPGEAVLDVACGTGVVAFAAARAVGPAGRVLGVDLADAMVQASRQRAQDLGLGQAAFERMDAEQLKLPDAGFDLALCALGLMYVPDPDAALRELHRVLRPGGRAVLAVWGERARCGWAPLFGIVDAEVRSEVCPLFFGLGQGEALGTPLRLGGAAGHPQRRRSDSLDYADAAEACAAAFAGGPVALAWSRFDVTVREARAVALPRVDRAMAPTAWVTACRPSTSSSPLGDRCRERRRVGCLVANLFGRWSSQRAPPLRPPSTMTRSSTARPSRSTCLGSPSC